VDADGRELGVPQNFKFSKITNFDIFAFCGFEKAYKTFYICLISKAKHVKESII